MPQPTLLDILNKTSAFFQAKGIPNPKLDAQLLLGHVLGLKRLDLYLNFDRPLTEAELEACRELVRRRAAREPLQHILGHQPFRKLDLKCDRRALIPRPETESLVDLVLALPGGAEAAILDIGVGAGPILLSLTQELPGATVEGCDLAPGALELTRENAARNGLELRGRLARSDLFSAFPAGDAWDILVSNPPYIGARELPGLEPEVRDHDPRAALVGGEEGWELPLRLIEEGHGRLRPGGWMVLEVAPGVPAALRERTRKAWRAFESLPDYAGAERYLRLGA